MTKQQRSRLRSIEGQQVSVALRGGTRIDDCNLVSSRPQIGQLWLFVNGEDVFIAMRDIVDVWETDIKPPRAA